MILNKIYICIIFVSITFTGCLRTYYPAIYQTSSYPLIYETVDSTQGINRFYSLDITISKGNYNNESLQLLKGSYTIVDTKDYYNINYKVFGYGGNYKVSGLENYDGNKSVFGVGWEFSTSFNFKINSLKMGLGINAGIESEFGGYYNFRIAAEKEGKIESEKKLIFLTFSVFPVISYEFSKSTILSTQANLGIPGLISPSLVLNNNGYIYWLSWIPDYVDRDNIFGSRIVVGLLINVNNL
jgi:hypothetical protein